MQYQWQQGSEAARYIDSKQASLIPTSLNAAWISSMSASNFALRSGVIFHDENTPVFWQLAISLVRYPSTGTETHT